MELRNYTKPIQIDFESEYKCAVNIPYTLDKNEMLKQPVYANDRYRR